MGIADAMFAGLKAEQLRPKREAVLKVLNRHADVEKVVHAVKRSNGERRVFRFTSFGAKVGYTSTIKGLVNVLDHNAGDGEDPEPRMLNLDGVLMVDVPGKRYDWSAGTVLPTVYALDGEGLPVRVERRAEVPEPTFEDAQRLMDELF